MNKKIDELSSELIAPCGMNCGLCISYQAMKQQLKQQGFQKKYCEGCRPRGKNCVFLKNHCDRIGTGQIRFCFQCPDYPCKRLKSLDKRYRTKYHMSMIENLNAIKETGIENFLAAQTRQWRCSRCGELKCCHNGLCLNCELEKLKQNKQYCWDQENNMEESKEKYETIDEYISQFPEAIRELLTQIRNTIKAAAPEATEKISYQMPTFYYHGNLVHFAGHKNHIGFYPTPSGMDTFAEELSAYKQGKGSVQFPLDQPLPLSLITRMVKARVLENNQLAAKKKAGKTKKTTEKKAGLIKPERLIMLGTGNAAVTKCYNTCFAIEHGDDYFLVDTGGGNGILTQLEKAEIPLNRIHDIFISHEHTDHLLGLIWLIRMIAARMKKGSYDGDLNIYCHAPLNETILTIVRLTVQEKFTTLIGERILFHIIDDQKNQKIMGYPVTFFDIRSTKAKQFGFNLILNSGKKLTFLGDEPYQEHEYPYAFKADWLLHEAFCLYRDRDIFQPYEKDHTTVKEACEIAEKLEVRNLILYHTEDRNLEQREALYVEEGRNYFSGNLLVPDDLTVIAL
jgi:ribonuclease Z